MNNKRKMKQKKERARYGLYSMLLCTNGRKKNVNCVYMYELSPERHTKILHGSVSRKQNSITGSHQ
jgi:hypothetical protein